MKTSRAALARLALLLAFGLAAVRSTCLGSACDEQHAAAKAHGLLGGTLLQDACPAKKYPSSGSLRAVTTKTRITDLKWAGGPNGTSNEKYVFALTADVDGMPGGALWRSDDSGRPDSWKDMTPAFAAVLPEGEATTVGVTALHWHSSNPARILFQGKGAFHFVSGDYGQTLKPVRSPGGTLGFGQTIKPHPHRPDWLLARAKRPACVADTRSPACGYDLFLSKDFGGEWANLTAATKGRVASFRDFEWGARIPMFNKKPTPDEAVFATLHLAGDAAPGGRSAGGLYPGWDADLHYAVSLDFFASFPLARVVPCGNLFEVVGARVYLAVPSMCPLGPDGRKRAAPPRAVAGRTVTLYVSDEDADDFDEMCLPANVEDDGYNLIHTHANDGAFVLADHAEEGSRGSRSDSPTSDVYAPGGRSARLSTLSARSVYRRESAVDFERLEGVQGGYIANQVDPAGLDPAARWRAASYLQTRVSHTGGASWAPLAAPASYRHARCKACEPGAQGGCDLHLHGPTSWQAPEGSHPNFYTTPSAPGLVVGTGTVGAHLDFGADAACTWVSRDAGLTWEDSLDFGAIYEIGARGQLLVAARHKSDGSTDKVLLSADQGACWAEVALPEAMYIENIRTPPGSAGAVFVVHGTACYKTPEHPGCTFEGGSALPGKLVVLLGHELLGADWKECSVAEGSADYEAWVVPKEGACLLGQRRTVRRRARGAACFDPASYSPPPEVAAPCDCTAADTECEYGFERVPDGGPNATCVAMPGLEESACPGLKASCYHMSSTHLRLVHGDTCANVARVIPDTDGKGGGGGGRGGGGGHHSKARSFFIFVLVSGILLVVAGLVWTHLLPEDTRQSLAQSVAPALGVLGALAEGALDLVITAWDWARAKVAGLSSRRDAEAAYFEPLADRGELDLDPDDHRSPPLFR